MKYRFPKTIVFSFFLINLLIGNLFAQNLKISTEEQIGEDVRLAPCNSAERMAAVKKLFIKMGASEKDISTQKFKEGENLVIKKKGDTEETIVVGAD